MATPFVIPDAWQHHDWADVCSTCRQPHFLVAIAEARLPMGHLEVIRCNHCTRALWYRSNANPVMLEDYHQRVLRATQQPRHWKSDRQPDHGQSGSGFHEKRKGRPK